MIKVKNKDGHEFIVVVEKGDARFKYEVILDEEYYWYLTKGKISQEKLIEESFRFLLERESEDSIFSKFNLKIIKDYFPEYEKVIKNACL